MVKGLGILLNASACVGTEWSLGFKEDSGHTLINCSVATETETETIFAP